MSLRLIYNYIYKYIDKCLSPYASDKSLDYFRELNIFEDKNLQNKTFFFLFATLLGYASTMMYHIPYHDDCARYVYNYPCGSVSDGRIFTEFLEKIIFLSEISFDIAPLSQFISCLFIAYATAIITKIFGNHDNYFDLRTRYLFLACFIPITVNPYILETLLFRFDNLFMSGAFLCSVLAAYISTKNDKGSLFFQILLLFYTLLLYQSTISAYFIIYVILVLKRFIAGEDIHKIIYNMKYWILSALLPALIYFPLFFQFISKTRLNKEQLILPYTLHNIYEIFQSFIFKLNALKYNWGNTNYGILVFLAFLNLLFFYLYKIIKDKKFNYKIFNIIIVIMLFTALLVAIFGINILLPSDIKQTAPRTISSIGIFISFILCENFHIFRLLPRFFRIIGKNLIFIISVWNIVLIYSFMNILHVQYSLQQHIYYALGCDLDRIVKNFKGDKAYLHFNGVNITPTFNNFLNEYPLFRYFVVSKWYYYNIVFLASYSPSFYHAISNIPESSLDNKKHFEPKEQTPYIFNLNYKKRCLLKQTTWYDIFIIDDKIIDISFKNGNTLFPEFDFQEKLMTKMTIKH